MKQENPAMDMEFIEVTLNPLRAWKAGIRMFPAVKIGEHILSGVILKPETVRQFVTDHWPA